MPQNLVLREMLISIDTHFLSIKESINGKGRGWDQPKIKNRF